MPSSAREAKAFVYFIASTHAWRWISPARLKRLVRRRPAFVRGVAIRLFLTAKAHPSPLIHIAIGDDRIVVETGPRGSRVWFPATEWVAVVPGLRLIVEVPVTTPLNLSALDGLPPTPVWPTVRRVLWGTDSDDCVASTIRVLRAAGCHVPPAIIEPAELAEWLCCRFPHEHVT